MISLRRPSEARVSIHAPREGCDYRVVVLARDGVVSIHAPREGCDKFGYRSPPLAQGFNSRTPGGVRLLSSLES